MTYQGGATVSYQYDLGVNGKGRLSAISEAATSVAWALRRTGAGHPRHP
ncbi:MAG: hypothetical protein U1F68_05525 [Gammaproteobacteria bacterium]